MLTFTEADVLAWVKRYGPAAVVESSRYAPPGNCPCPSFSYHAPVGAPTRIGCSPVADRSRASPAWSSSSVPVQVRYGRFGGGGAGASRANDSHVTLFFAHTGIS